MKWTSGYYKGCGGCGNTLIRYTTHEWYGVNKMDLSYKCILQTLGHHILGYKTHINKLNIRNNTKYVLRPQ